MAKLTDDQKQAIVVHLAQFRSHSETAKLVSEEFGVAVDRFQVRGYDPTSMRCVSSDRWRELFRTTRRASESDLAAIPISHPAYRLNILQRLLDRAVSSGNSVLAANLLKQAAKEMGGMYNSSRNTGDAWMLPITADEARAELKLRAHAARERALLAGSAGQH